MSVNNNDTTISNALRESSSNANNEANKVCDPTNSSSTAAGATTTGGGAGGGADPSNNSGGGGDEQEHQLSADLLLFLSHPSLRAALADGSLDLQSYSATVEDELAVLERDCIARYRQQAPAAERLARDAATCRDVLARLREMLLGFRADLGGLSGDIRALQSQSRQLDVQLRNRRAAEQRLRRFLERCVVSPATAQAVLTGPVNATFVAAVQEVQRLYRNCTDSSSSSSSSNHNSDASNPDWSCGLAVADTVCGREMKQHLQTLRMVATKRSREHLLQQMAALRRPQTHVRLLQVHGLLKYAALYDFLQDCHPATAREIFHVYTESMRQTLQQLFRTYCRQLLPLDRTSHQVTRADVIAVDDAVLKERSSIITGGGSGGGGGGSGHNRTDVFALGARARDCFPNANSSSSDNGSGENAPIAAHVAALQGDRFHYERLFQSWLGHLVDAVTNEHVFCRQFFKRDAFAALFGPTLSLLTEQLENYLFSCHDGICLLLLIKVTHSYRRLARQRKIHSLDPFLDQITHLLWPRLKTVMEGHLRSLQQADAVKLGMITSTTGTGAAGSSSSPADASFLHGAHYVSRRFAEFHCSIWLILHANASDSHHKQHHRGSSLKSSSSPGRTGGITNESGSSSTPATPMSNRKLSVTVTTTDSNQQPIHSSSSPPTAGDQLLQDLQTLLDAYLQLLERLAEETNPNNQKKRTVFLINNLDHCLTIFQERRVSASTALLEQLVMYREQFVEEELLTYFSKMIAFVQQTEAYLVAQKGNSNTAAAAAMDGAVNLSVVDALAGDFAAQWKTALAQINREILSYFSNFRNGMEILKHCLTQLLLYYTRFQDIVRKVYGKKNTPPAIAKELVSTNVILAEIKKYALAI